MKLYFNLPGSNEGVMKNEDSNVLWLKMKKILFHITSNHIELLTYAVHFFFFIDKNRVTIFRFSIPNLPHIF